MKKAILSAIMVLFTASGGYAGGFDLDFVSVSDLKGSEAGVITSMPVPAISSGSQSATSAEVLEKYGRIVDASPATKLYLGKNELLSLFRSVVNDQVASLDMLDKYDPSGAIGFCFGRAMAVQLLARKMGLANESIKKLFIVGDLRSEADPEWRFHVTALVKGPRDTWFAIDPVFEKPLSALAWIKTARDTWDKKGIAKLYFTGPSSVFPDLRAVPSPEEEKREHLIELSFDPENKAGFSAKPEFGPLAYSLSDDSEAGYFSQVSGTAAGFDFLSVTSNGTTVPYNNYFADLMDNVLAQGAGTGGAENLHGEASSGAAHASSMALSPRAGNGNPYSMKFKTFLKNKP